jgi:hypothetical protein
VDLVNHDRTFISFNVDLSMYDTDSARKPPWNLALFPTPFIAYPETRHEFHYEIFHSEIQWLLNRLRLETGNSRENSFETDSLGYENKFNSVF